MKQEFAHGGKLQYLLLRYTQVLITQMAQPPPAPFFLGLSDQKVSEAMLVQVEAKYVKHEPCSVVALLEKETAISKKTLSRAMNRLAAVTIFRGDEEQTIKRIGEEVLGRSLH